MKVGSMFAVSLALHSAYAAELKPETLASWDQYIQAANSRMQERVHLRTGFLWIDETPELIRRVQSGEIVTSSVGEHSPKKVPNGLIHHWIGAAFVPNVGVADIFNVVRDLIVIRSFTRHW